MHLIYPILVAALAGLTYGLPQKSGGQETGGSGKHGKKLLVANEGATIDLHVKDNKCYLHFTNMLAEGCTGDTEHKKPFGTLNDGKCDAGKMKGHDIRSLEDGIDFCKGTSIRTIHTSLRFHDDQTYWKAGDLQYWTSEYGDDSYVHIGLKPKKLRFNGKTWEEVK
ncbi:hypothetical protein N7492_002609 [Penicillium capsulatum]|uniref:Uncharacterized protein n=1 Tax=Penicillium capsulatum TaxID=69766 RepID=A0A9W9II51_9EURO|nr:hypothetical protein N7492_002609 [Penicillium capsulatum]KAJ6122789.1 hypothetical protein N7512_005254 [Penicillium capsulatum]